MAPFLNVRRLRSLNLNNKNKKGMRPEAHPFYLNLPTERVLIRALKQPARNYLRLNFTSALKNIQDTCVA